MSNEAEWVDWNGAMRLLKAAEVGATPWRVLSGWCEEGLIEAKAAAFTGFGEVLQDASIPAGLWGECGRRGAAHLDCLGGSIRGCTINPETNKQCTFSIMGTSFRKDQLLGLLPHLKAEQVTAALAEQGNWLDGKKAAASALDSIKGKGGMKKDQAAWDSFWMAVVELAVQERLNIRQFPGQPELRAEILEMINDALKDRTIKPVVSQIWNRWIEPTR